MRFAPLRHLALILPILCAAAPDAEAQYTNNAPFSGAIYIVNPNGQAVGAGTNQCPSYASVSCNNIGQPSWCCPNSYTCASPANSNGLIGCCPAGSSCGGTVNVASVTTITVVAAAPQQTSVVYVQPPPAATTVAVYNVPTTHVVQQGNICRTQTMDGPGLPTTRQGDCGLILVVNEGTPNLKAIGYGMGAAAFLLHLVLGRMFRWI